MKTGVDIYKIAREYIYKIPELEEFTDRIYFKFHLVKDSIGRGWLYTMDAKAPATQVYCTDSRDWNKAGEGFGGSTLTFQLVDGEEFKLRGGWHSNADSLFAATGVDLRNLSSSITHIWSKDGKILYDEQNWVIGQYDRTDEILKSLGLENEMVFVAHRSSGGAFFGWRNYHA